MEIEIRTAADIVVGVEEGAQKPGTVKLIGTNRNRLVDEVSLLLDSEEAFASMANAVNPYGDGEAARRTLEAIHWRFGEGSRLVGFFTS